MVECTAFVYKHILCCKAELSIGKNGYEIVYHSKLKNTSQSNLLSTKDTTHRIVIDWNTISGLKRVNKQIDNTLQLTEQLIIESTSYPKLYTSQYNYNLDKYETKIDSLRSHYIGLEYNIIHSNDINIPLLNTNPTRALLFNQSLPEWIWIPLLTHNLRIFIQNMILFGNIALFIWTIYQITKYTSIIKCIYNYIFYPFFNYISQAMLKKIYYYLNLMQFHVVIKFMSTIFSLFYTYIPINSLYKIISFFDQHVLQQIIGLFTMFYRIFYALFQLFSPLVNLIITISKHLFMFLSQFKCFNCALFQQCNGPLCRSMTYIWQCSLKCCRFCRQTQVITDSKILKVGVNGINVINKTQNNGIFTYIWNNLKGIIDVLWLTIGKPIKHSYDFFRYIRSEVGIVVAKCIRKCCKKSTEKVKEKVKNVIRTPKKKNK
eukprot:367593_1